MINIINRYYIYPVNHLPEKLVPRTDTGRAMIRIPDTIAKAPTTFPELVFGVSSP